MRAAEAAGAAGCIIVDRTGQERDQHAHFTMSGDGNDDVTISSAFASGEVWDEFLADAFGGASGGEIAICPGEGGQTV